MIEATDSFTLGPAIEAVDGVRCDLLRDGEGTGVVVPGRFLEAQFTVEGRAVLFLTHGILDEEQLDICLIDRRGIVDQITLAKAYATGLLAGVSVLSERAVQFSFFGDQRWKLDVHETPGFRGLGLIGGASYQNRFWRYLAISKS